MTDSSNATAKRPSIANDRRLWWLAVLALAGLLIFQFGYDKAFPAASLDLSNSRASIQKIAAVWADKVGYHPANANNRPEIIATTFTERAVDKAFLEQELGQEKANKLMREGAPIWLWKSRFCREHQFEQCFISLTPAGQFNGFVHEYRNDFALKSLAHDDAEKLARDFLSEIVGISVGDVGQPGNKYTLIRDESKAQINRRDYVFVWEDQSVALKGAYIDLEVHVSGDKITFMDRYLHIPQDWLRKYNSMRAYNEQLFNVAQFFWFILLAVSVFVFLFATANHKIRWRFTLLSAVAFVLTMFVDMINSTENAIFTYSTQIDFQTFLLQYVFNCLSNTLTWFVAAVVLVGAAEFLYRTYFPGKLAPEKWLSVSGLKQPEILKNLVAGHLGACIYVGWIITYYIWGQKIGFWTPLQVQNAGVYSGFVPAIGAMHVGILASAHEELIYRVIALITVLMTLRRIEFFKARPLLAFWFANFLQAACWGFMHSSYPQQPAYARGVELMLNGMLFGWFTQNFGLLSCLVSHYLVDVVIVLRPLLASNQLSLSIPSLLVCIPFVLLIACIPAIAVLRRSRVSASEILTNEQLTASLKEPIKTENASIADFRYSRLSAGTRLILFVLSLVLMAGSVIFRHGNMVGEPARLRINREQAVSVARQSLNSRKIDTSSYLTSAQLISNLSSQAALYEMQYLFEYTNASKAADLAAMTKFGYVWNVRFFKPGNTREYFVHVNGHGREIGFDVIDLETASGARLDLETAKVKSRKYIESCAPNLVPFTYISGSIFKRANRTDYELGYEVPKLKVADAPFKMTTDLVGDQVSNFTADWLVPDRWRDERERKTLKEQLATASHIIWPVIAGVLVAFWAIGLLRHGVFRFRLPILTGCLIGLLSLISFLNMLPSALQGMPTTLTVDRYFLDQLSIWLRLVGTEIVKNVLMAVLSLAVFKMFSPDVEVWSICKLTFCRQTEPALREQQRQLWFDAVLIGYWFAAARFFILTLAVSLGLFLSPNVSIAALGLIVPNINTALPGLSMVVEQISKGWGEVVSAAIFAGLYLKYVRKFPFFVLLLILGSMLYCLDMPYPNTVDYVIGVGRNVILGLLFYLFIAKLAKRNILAYLLCGSSLAVIFKLPLYLIHAPRVAIFEIGASCLGLILPLLVCLYFLLTPRFKSENV